MFNATSVEARDWSEAGFYLAEASERSGPCVDQKKWARWMPETGGAEILSRRQRTHTLVAYDGMGLELGGAGGRLNGS